MASRSSSQLRPASAPEPSGIAIVDPAANVEADRVALEHPEVGEQVVAEVDRLGALQVRVAGHPPVAVGLGELEQPRHQGARPARAARAARPRTNSARSVATWSLRERPVCSLPPSGPTSSVSRRSTAMWMSSSSALNVELAALELGGDRVEPAFELGELIGRDHPGALEPRGVGARALDVLAPEPPVEADRGVDAREQWVVRLFEAGHGR